jgi:toxin-antitoxin system PIN domain toxin
MIAVDANVLVHAGRVESPLHRPALGALRGLAEGPEPWGLPVFALGEFVRVVTAPGLFEPPTSVASASRNLEALLESPSLRVLSPGPRYWRILADLLARTESVGDLVLSAQVAAVCLEHGAFTVLTEDQDLARFPGIRVEALPRTT